MGFSRAGLLYAIASWRVRLQAREDISAMVRVRNEEEFLFAAVSSIVDLVNEIVIVDNLSSDGTPGVIAALQRKFPTRVSTHSYPFEVRKVGREHWELASQRTRRPSPHLSSTYYNWALRRCRHPFILKWDGDMIACPAFEASLAGGARRRGRSLPSTASTFTLTGVTSSGRVSPTATNYSRG